MDKIRTLLVLAASAGIALSLLPHAEKQAGELPPAMDGKPHQRAGTTAERRSLLEPVTPESLGIHTAAIATDHARVIEALWRDGNDSELNLALLAWFQADAPAGRAWLDAHPDHTRLQDALQMIADYFASSGEATLALEWAKLLQDPVRREGAIFSILAAGRRSGTLNEADLRAAELSDERIQQLISGVADD